MNTKQLIEDKYSLMLLGESVICSTEEMEESEHLDNEFFIRSLINPNQLGTKDEYLCWIKEKYTGKDKNILSANKRIDEFLEY